MEKFNTLIGSTTPVLVDFYADWCGPCKAMSPAIQAVGKDVEGKARVIKVNIDKNQAAAMQYNVRAVPTFIIFKQGKPVWRHAGMIDKNTLEKQLLAFAS
jgi:thioredoxin 1